MHCLRPLAMRGKYGSYFRKPPALGYQPLNQKLLQSIGQKKENVSYTRQCGTSHKKRLKVALWGFFNTAAFRPIVFLSPTSSRIHLQRRHASYRCARPLPGKVGTITNEFCLQIGNSRKSTRFFYIPQSWDMGHIILLPLRRKAY